MIAMTLHLVPGASLIDAFARDVPVSQRVHRTVPVGIPKI